MSTVQTAVGECLRTGIDALRGLGYSFSVADRLSRMLTWSEATGLGGLAHIRASESRIRAGMSKSFAISSLAAGPMSITILDAAGKSLFDAGPRVLDLANADARLHGAGLAIVRGTFGTLLLGELTQTATERGLCSLILFRGGAEGDGFDGILLRTPDSLAEVVSAESDVASILGRFAPVLASVVGHEAADKAGALLDGGAGGISSTTVAILSFPIERSDAIAALFQEACIRAGLPIVRRQLAAWRRALAEGFCVDAADWAYLHSLVARIRIQTSERSRTHAG